MVSLVSSLLEKVLVLFFFSFQHQNEYGNYLYVSTRVDKAKEIESNMSQLCQNNIY